MRVTITTGLLFALVLLFGSVAVRSDHTGDYTEFYVDLRQFPSSLEAARHAGYLVDAECVPAMGIHAAKLDEFGEPTQPILLYNARGELIGYEFESVTEQPVPPWDRLPKGHPGMEFEHWTLHLYFREFADACAPMGGRDAEAEVRAVLKEWVQAFSTGNLFALEPLYWHDERLTSYWPDAAEPFLMDGWEEVKTAYRSFAEFVAANPVTLTTRQLDVKVFSDTAIATSYWTFSMAGPGEDEPTTELGRATFVLKKMAGSWRIIHEHFSHFPGLEP